MLIITLLVSTIVNAEEVRYQTYSGIGCDDDYKCIKTNKNSLCMTRDDFYKLEATQEDINLFEMLIPAAEYRGYEGICVRRYYTRYDNDNETSNDNGLSDALNFSNNKARESDVPNQIIKVQTDNEAYNDCRDDLNECNDKKTCVDRNCSMEIEVAEKLQFQNTKLSANNTQLTRLNIDLSDRLYTYAQREGCLVQIVTSVCLLILLLLSVFFNFYQHRKHRINKKNFVLLKKEILKAGREVSKAGKEIAKAKAGKDILARALRGVKWER